MNFSRKWYLLKIFVTRPSEFLDRVKIFLEGKYDYLFGKRQFYYNPITFENFIKINQIIPTESIQEFLKEAEIVNLEKSIKLKTKNIEENIPFPLIHSADFVLGRLCYIICRYYKPKVVVETGVAYGVTSSFILTALDKNNSGKLISIDLPPVGEKSDDYVGILIPTNLKKRWVLKRGTSQKELPKVLENENVIDIFIHDSLHTYKNMKFEFELAFKHLGGEKLIISDDSIIMMHLKNF